MKPTCKEYESKELEYKLPICKDVAILKDWRPGWPDLKPSPIAPDQI